MTLADDAVHLYIVRPEVLLDPDQANSSLLTEYQALLSDDERLRLNKFLFKRHRDQFLITRALQRTSLSEYANVEPAQWHFQKNIYGKPFIGPSSSTPESQHGLKFNISHTAGMIVCAITSGNEVGVDVEDRQRSTRAAFSSLFSYFSATEISELEALPSDLQKHRFFQHWTLKEAYIKARGAGFAIPLNQFGFHFDGNRLSGFNTHPDLEDPPERWQFWQLPYDDRHEIALALESNKADIQLTVMESVPLQQTRVIHVESLSHLTPNSQVGSQFKTET